LEDIDTIEKAFSLGADDYLQKPINNEVLKTRLEMLIEEKEILKKEKEIKIKLENQIKKNQVMQNDIESIKKDFGEKIEKPKKTIKEALKLLEEKEDTNLEFKEALIVILQNLGSSEIYKPHFLELESATREWSDNQYINFEEKLKKLNKEYNGEDLLLTRRDSLYKIQWSNEIFHDINSFDCNIFTNDIPDKKKLILNITFMFKDLSKNKTLKKDLYEEFKIDDGVFQKFLKKIEEMYHENPYHNFLHSMDVTQFSYACLKTKQLSEYFAPIDKLILMFSAICHDLDHPGLNNNYQINSKSRLSFLYNGK
jgi:YesN/AraC family two-component response regulator